MFTNRLPWVVLLLVWMVGATWWHVCTIKQLCADDRPAPESVAVAIPTVTMPRLLIADGAQFSIKTAGHFSFAKSGAMADRNGVSYALDSAAAYLIANLRKTLTIRGYYAPFEQNTSSFPNVGLARADGIKQYFVQRGVPAEQLTTEGIGSDELVFSATGDSLYGGLNFTFAESVAESVVDPTPAAPAPAIPVTEESLAAGETFTSVFKPLDLYFTLGEAQYIKTEATSQFFAEATKYLMAHKDKKLVLTGYTDNSGPDAVNRQLSRDRANAVKAKLRRSGIATEQIEVVAKGEADPKADNSTLNGRRANRRVTVVVQ